MPDRAGEDGLCAHGNAGFCADCRPPVFVVGDVVGPPSVRVRGREVWRTKPDGSLGWVTRHWTKRGARRAARRYLEDGIVKGRRP
jgi:hypothetical protein